MHAAIDALAAALVPGRLTVWSVLLAMVTTWQGRSQ
jgi:hypothetical protein